MIILVIDHHCAMRELLNHFLPEIGHHPVSVSDCSEALAVLNLIRFDVVLLDYSLILGQAASQHESRQEFEFVRTFRRGLPKAKIVILSGAADKEAVQRFKTAGSDAILPKPIILQELHDLLSIWQKEAVGR